MPALFVGTLADAVKPWASLYADSKGVATAVTFVHLAGLLAAGGFALASDRATLRSFKAPEADRMRQLEELHAIHRPVLLGLSVTMLSGLLLFTADLKTFLPSPFFWTKMGLIALLLLNGYFMTRAERALRGRPANPVLWWRRLRVTTLASLVLWFAVLLAGTMLANLA